ncbi:aldo/keto reductase [Leptospira ellisii]|uniref:Aldo/keto reductase n=1 Tax=Leptospira ellisii TaxID=2023197 RepID=A0A2N0BE84_9LEPT|nr:aldo/keto reductase [Leptospira ellisii]MDV6234335.1 aldo/keto reductase [Leptospira ellisii]PJZ94863.1 aldo/keto reductase [Leptospira ellisii]PKA05317.1 aldo/keto reductase [Leptospira ellisii]
MKEISRGRFLRDSAALLAFLSGYLNSFSESFGKENAGMLQRTVHSSGEKIPAIGLGTWQTMDVFSDSPELASLREVWSEFIRSGGGVVDSSPMYGRSEEIVGLLSSESSAADKKRIFYATKVWIRGESAGKAQIDSSFRKFGTDKIDLFQIHNLVDTHIHLKTLRELQTEGRIRYVGLTHYVSSAFSEMEKIAKSERIEFLQIPYSIVTREAENRILPFAESNGISVLINRPFEEGELFRRVKGKTLPEYFREWDCESFGQAFLKFILSNTAVTCAIPATSKLSHLRDNLKAGLGRLPAGKDREEFKKRLLREL